MGLLTRSKSRRWIAVLVATFAGGIGAMVLFRLLLPRQPDVQALKQVGARLPTQEDLHRFDVEAAERQRAYLESPRVQAILTRWKSVPWLEISSGNSVAIDAAIRAGMLPNGDVQVSEAMRQSLVDRLRAHLLARASATADDYLALAKVEGAPWIDRNASAWRPADWVSISMTGHPADRDHPEALISASFERVWKQNESWAFLGAGSEGVRIGFVRATSDVGAKSLPAALSGSSAIEAGTMWFGRGTSSLGLRSDHDRLVRVLERDKSVVACEALIRVKLKNEATMVWASRFFWDPRSADWHLLHMERRSHDAPGMVY